MICDLEISGNIGALLVERLGLFQMHRIQLSKSLNCRQVYAYDNCVEVVVREKDMALAAGTFRGLACPGFELNIGPGEKVYESEGDIQCAR